VADGWLARKPGGWRQVRNAFARRLRSVRVWSFAIVILIGLDFVIFVRALLRVF
jgi:hypothetical protein